MAVVDDIKDKINTLSGDLKAEVVVSAFLENVSQRDDLNYYINPQSQFKRSYRKDIIGAEVVDFEFDSRQFLKIDISRDGIYDLLPEAVLHYRQHQNKDISADEMAKYYQERKKEEEQTRLFFLPFENEFFDHSIAREDREKKYLFNLNGEKPIDFLYDFWGIDENLPQELLAKFLRLIPYMYKIAGDISLTESCLAYLLNEKVSISQGDFKWQSDKNERAAIGESRLGIDFVCGHEYLDHTVNMEVFIGPLVNSDFKSYINNGNIRKFLDVFYEFIFPLEMEIQTTVLLATEKEKFEVAENNNPILGITTRI